MNRMAQQTIVPRSRMTKRPQPMTSRSPGPKQRTAPPKNPKAKQNLKPRRKKKRTTPRKKIGRIPAAKEKTPRRMSPNAPMAQLQMSRIPPTNQMILGAGASRMSRRTVPRQAKRPPTKVRSRAKTAVESPSPKPPTPTATSSVSRKRHTTRTEMLCPRPNMKVALAKAEPRHRVATCAGPKRRPVATWIWAGPPTATGRRTHTLPGGPKTSSSAASTAP